MNSGDIDSQPDSLPNDELATSGHILSGVDGGCFSLVLIGDVRLVWCVALERYCESMFMHSDVNRFYVDLCQASNLDSTTLGVLAKLAILCRKKLGIAAELCFDHPDIERLVISMGFASVFSIIDRADSPSIEAAALKRLCGTDCTEEEVKRSVLEAHQVLAGMSDDNYNKFKDLIENLKE